MSASTFATNWNLMMGRPSWARFGAYSTASSGPSLWAILDVAMLWYFGNMLERTIGRTRMAWLLSGIWLSMTVAYSTRSAYSPAVGRPATRPSTGIPPLWGGLPQP